MPKASSVDRLPDEVRAEIGRLRMRGCTLDQILAHLAKLMPPEDAPSRSALGRWALKMDALGADMRRSRQMAEALASQLGDAPESQAARLNIELLHNVMMQLHLNAAEADADQIAEGGALALKGDPESVMMMAKAIESLTRASKTNADFIAVAERRAEERGKKGAMAAVEAVAKTRGISADTLAAIKTGIFGVTT